MINKKRLTKTFLDLVQIDSPSGEEKNVAKFTANRLTDLGGQVEFDSYGNVIAKFKGAGNPVMLNSHLDTVEPGRGIKPIIKGDKITSDGTTILGADAKSGVASILEGIESVMENGTSHVPIEIVFTLGEEAGLLGAVNLDYSKIKSKIGVTLDNVRNVGHITTSAPGYSKVDVAITGRAAHAGFDPENGISAIKIASEIISKLSLGRIDHETTANIGIIRGGSARNAIPENAYLEAEIRSISLKKLQKHTKHFEEVISRTLAKYKLASVLVNIKTEFDPYVFDKSQQAVEQAIKTLEKININPKLEPSGGGADVNIFNSKGIEAVCVGAGFYNAHTTREYALISEMLQSAKFCEEFVSI